MKRKSNKGNFIKKNFSKEMRENSCTSHGPNYTLNLSKKNTQQKKEEKHRAYKLWLPVGKHGQDNYLSLILIKIKRGYNDDSVSFVFVWCQAVVKERQRLVFRLRKLKNWPPETDKRTTNARNGFIKKETRKTKQQTKRKLINFHFKR